MIDWSEVKEGTRFLVNDERRTRELEFKNLIDPQCGIVAFYPPTTCWFGDVICYFIDELGRTWTAYEVIDNGLE